MGRHRYHLLLIIKSILIFGISSLVWVKAVIANSQNNQEMNNEKRLSLNGQPNPIESSFQELLPMPLGKIDEASKKVQSSRDPFQDTPTIESSDLEVLQSALRFKGIVKSGNDLLAMIKTTKGQELYKVGDSLGNGFFVKGISPEELTVDISNGIRYYRLSLYSLSKYYE